MMDLKVQSRIVLGKKVRGLRQQGLIPAELFGHKIKNQHFSVPVKEFSKLYKSAGEHTLINLLTEKGEKIPVLINDVQRHPLSGEFLTIDFHQVRMDEKITAKIPIEFKGEAPAIKAGNILIKVLNEVEVEAFPQDMPHRFEIDLSGLEQIKQSIHVKDLKIPKEVKILTDLEGIIVTVTEAAKPEEVTPPPTPEAEAAPAAEAQAEAGEVKEESQKTTEKSGSQK